MSKVRENNEFDVRVGSNIKELREKQNMTQQEIADKLNVSRASVCHWETGERALYFYIAKDLCKVLNCSLEDLLK